MAVKTFYVDIDLNGNEIQNAVVHPVGVLPAGKEGQIAYLNTDKQVHFFDGTNWHTMGEVQDIVKADPITVTNAAGTYTIGITNVTTTKPGAMTAADKVKLDGLITIKDDTDLPHIAITGTPLIAGPNVNAAFSSADAWIQAHIVLATRPHGELKVTDKDNDGTLTANSDDLVASQKATKTYVDGKIAGSGRPPVAWDPTLAGTKGVSNYPNISAGTGGTIKQGDQFIVTKTGTIGTGATPVKPGDMLLANNDMPGDTTGVGDSQAAASWSEIVSPTTLPDATELVKGVAMISTQAEVDAGTDDTEFITPKKLKTYLDNTHKRAEIKTGTSGGSVTVTHGFNNMNVIVDCYMAGKEVDAEITVTNTTVTATLNTYPSPLTVVVTGIQS